MQVEAKDMQVEAKDMDQGQRAVFRFQREISKCGSFGHEIMVRKQFVAKYCRPTTTIVFENYRVNKNIIIDNNPVPGLLGGEYKAIN